MNTSSQSDCVVLGGGAHAAVLIDALIAAGAELPRAVLDEDRSRWGEEILGVPIEGGDDLLPRLMQNGVKSFIVGVGSTTATRLRAQVFERAVLLGLVPQAVVHPRAFASAHARLGPGVQLLPGCIVHTNASLGRNVLVNSGAIVEHDCRVGDHVHVSPRACLSGGVEVGAQAHVGAGAVVRQGIRIGARAVVGAGAVVVREVPADVVVAGVPARVLRRGDPDLLTCVQPGCIPT